MGADGSDTRRTTTRRKALATIAGAGAASMAGCSSVYEFLEEAAAVDETLRTVAVESDQDGEFYYPTPENIESGVYSPLTRPLYIYVNHASLAAKPNLVGSFVEHYFEGQQAFARQTGYYATTDAVREQNLTGFRALLGELGVGAPARDQRAFEDDTVECSGSNTVAPVTSAAGESFEDAHSDVLVAVNPEGTGAGFQEFARGNADIQSASRTILPSEAEIAAENDVEYSLYTIAQDGVAIVAHATNDWCTELTLEELTRIWATGSSVTRWSDVRPEWPDEEIGLWGRDDASGTFDYFTNEINGAVGEIRQDYSEHTDTGSVMEGVAADPNALGWGGVGYYTELKQEPFEYTGEYGAGGQTDP